MNTKGFISWRSRRSIKIIPLGQYYDILQNGEGKGSNSTLNFLKDFNSTISTIEAINSEK